jgi:polysaccharide pyruvyl transferase WcaK-like protein
MSPANIRRRLFSDKLWQAYADADIIILAHDNAFSFAHNFLILFGKLLGKKVVMYGASILPHVYEKTLPRIFTKFCLEKLDLITLREPKSQQFLERVGLNQSRLHVTADKAFLLEPVDKNIALGLLKENKVDTDHKPLIGMTVVYGSGVFKRGLIKYTDPDEKYAVYVGVMARVVDFLVKELDATVIFMPHTIGPSKEDDDRVVAGDVMRQVESTSGVVAINSDYTASELKGMIGCCDFFVGARTHSVIAATSMGVPSLVLSYPKDFRTYGIIGDMLEQHKWVYNIEYLQAEDLIELIKDAWNFRSETVSQLPGLVKKMKKKSLMNGTLLKEVLGARYQ